MPTPAELRKARKALGLTQADAARELDVRYETVSNWERGVTRIPRMLVYWIRWRMLHPWDA